MSEWISVNERLPELKDDSVIGYWGNGGMDMIHIVDYFKDITAGFDEHGNQRYTKWYISCGITHWMPLPAPPEDLCE